MMEYLSTKMPVIKISLEISSHPLYYYGLSSEELPYDALGNKPWNVDLNGLSVINSLYSYAKCTYISISLSQELSVPKNSW